MTKTAKMWPEVEKVKTENRHELILNGNDISKRLEESGLDLLIFELLNLNFLGIHDTCLEEIPDDIGKLSQLQSLVLHSNKLKSVNDNIGQLEKLKLLDLSRNLVETVPTALDKLKNIVTLNFSNNALTDFIKLSNADKLCVLNISNNKLKVFPDICYKELHNLSEVYLSGNEIEKIPANINKLSSIKQLELSQNKIKIIPGELADCNKLKMLDLKQNPISDRRLQKLIDQCRTKQIIDYVKQHSARSSVKTPENPKVSKKEEEEKEESLTPKNYKYKIHVQYAKDNDTKIIIDENVKNVREYFVGCLVDKIQFNDAKFKKFIQLQNRLHETVCGKRVSSTIATHDFKKLPAGDLRYTTRAPGELLIKPLHKNNLITGTQLFSKLQTEAENLRKEKKRSNYSGIHKYLSLIEGKPQFPCLLNSSGDVISFPPLTNSDISKIEVNSESMLIEVTGSVSLHLCKVAMDTILKELTLLLEEDITVKQVKTTDNEGNLKVVYPSKTDLIFENEILVVRE